MTNSAVVSSLCQKLGHGLEEVRLRALDTVLSKLDRGFLQVSDLMTSKDFIVKLLEWFGLKPCPSQERVLGLIQRILNTEGSETLVSQIGAERILLALNTIRTNLPSELCSLLDDIASLVLRAKTIDDQCDEDFKSYQRPVVTSNKDSASASAAQTGSVSDAYNLDASLQEALREHTETQQDSTERHYGLSGDSQFETTVASNVLKNIFLPWQPLIPTDRHVFIAVENSLTNTVDRVQLLNTCSFLTDVMIRDFPAEVFLQRPAIVLAFMKLLKLSLVSHDRNLAKMILMCLFTLTNALLSRLRFYQDPNMANQKQENFLRPEEDTASQISLQSSLSNPSDTDVEGQRRIPAWNDNIYRQSNSQTSSQTSSQSQSFPPTIDDTGRSHISGTQVPSDSADSEESSLLRLRQCSLPQFCLLGIHHVIPHVDEHPESCTLLHKLSHLLTECVTPQIWLAPASDVISSDIATHSYEMLDMLADCLLQSRVHTVGRLVHLQLLATTRHLLLRLVPLEVADRCLPRKMKTALCETLLDGPLHAFYPTLHSDILQYVQQFKNLHDIDCLKVFNSTLSVAESLSCAANLIMKSDLSDGSKFLLHAEKALSSLSFHQDHTFITLIFDCCSKNFNSWHLTESECNALSNILLKLLAHADLNIRRKAYTHLHRQVLGVLSIQKSCESPADALAFLLFNTPLLLEIITHGIASTDEVIQNSAEDIMLHALKGKFLLGSTHWAHFLSCLGPVWPLLQCWADQPSALGRSIITILNPDVGSQMHLGSPELLKGNLRLQFSKDDFVRGEALSRLIWLLTKEEEAFTKLPHVSTLHNCAKDNLCLVDKPFDVFFNVPEKPFFEESSLLQVLEIVQTRGLEPQILLSALTQIAAILEDPRHHELFLSRAGLTTSIEYLHASMDSNRVEVYPEVVVPAISILRSLSLFHSITRHQLSKDDNIFYSVLRGLMMFPLELRLRVNAAQLLAVLLFNDVIISSSPRTLSDGFVVRGLSVPHLIASKMDFPFVCTTHWRTSNFTEPLMSDVLLRHAKCRTFLATAWNLSYFKAELSPLLWGAEKTLPKSIYKAQEKFSPSLYLTGKSLQLLQASAMLNSCQRQLINIQGASNHNDVAKALEILKSILALYKMLKEIHQIMGRSHIDTQHFEQLYKTLPWRQTFRRFLMAAPASVEDQQLLIHILKFLRDHLTISRLTGFQNKDRLWLSKLLQHPSQPLPNLFHTVAHTGYAGDSEMPSELAHLPKWKELCKELLSIMTECALLEQFFSQSIELKTLPHCGEGNTFEDNKENNLKTKKGQRRHNPQFCGDSKTSSQTELERADRWVGEVVSSATDKAVLPKSSSWTHVIQNVISCLKSSDTQHFYNLAYLDWLLWALTHFTGKRGWSTGLRGSQLKAQFSELLTVLLELVQAFHLECGKGGSSFMGLSITRASILCLNHLLVEMQQYPELKWEDFWLPATRKASKAAVYIPWLLSLFQSRDPIVRAAALQLASGISVTSLGCDLVFSMLTDHTDVWLTPLCILLDHSEASAVREQAANLLTNLIRNRTVASKQASNEPANCSYNVLQQRVVEYGLLSEVWSIVDRLSLATSWEPSRYVLGNVGIGLMNWCVLESSTNRSSVAHLPPNRCILIQNLCGSSQDSDKFGKHPIPCTPSLLRSLCGFLDVLVNLNDESLHTFEKQGASGQFLRCLNSIPPFDKYNQRAMQLYCDTLRMYAGICHLVSRCISSNSTACQYILQQPNTSHQLLLLLDPTLFCDDSPSMLLLRDELWTEVLWLISGLLKASANHESCGEESGHSVLHSLLIRARGEPLASVFTIALSGSLFTDLQKASLACLQFLLSHPASSLGQPFSVLLDDVDADFNSSCVAVHEVNVEHSIGASLCRLLLALYDVHSLQMGSSEKSQAGTTDWRAQRATVAGSLSALLEVSLGAKRVALNQGLVELLCAQLGAVQSYLSVEPGETMKRLASKKKVCPVLQDAGLLLRILNSVTLKNINAKELAADIGVTDTIHKLWVWCLSQPGLLLTVLRFLATLTSGCTSASHSLVLTTTVPGLGLRRSPSSQSLLQALVALVLQETELANHAHDLTVLSLTCSILFNACHVLECRNAMTKGNLLRGIRHLHSSLSKKNPQKRQVETIWLSLLMQLSAFQEGQIVLPKVPDLLDYILHLAEGQKKNNTLALQVLRNLAFCPINRPRLLSSGDVLLLINKKLQNGDIDEQVAAAAALWALVANNQKGKLVAKCAGSDVHILDSLRQLAVCQRPGADFVAQLLNCVLRVLRHEPIRSAS